MPSAVEATTVPGEPVAGGLIPPRTGEYRVGDEVALFDEAGESVISGADFALAVVDEIDTPAHHRAHIGIAH